MSAAPAPRLASSRLSEAPLVHPTAEVVGGGLGRFTEIAEGASCWRRRSAIIPT